MDNSNILSVKFKREDKSQKVTVQYFFPDMNRNRTEEITDVPHSDFMEAIMQLSPFLGKVFHASEEHMGDYVANGLTFSKDNHVIITGKMVSSSGRVVGIATPQINLEELEAYKEFDELSDELNDVVSRVTLETLLLLQGTKKGVIQKTIDDAIEDNKEDLNQGLFSDEENNDETKEPEDEPNVAPSNFDFLNN